MIILIIEILNAIPMQTHSAFNLPCPQRINVLVHLMKDFKIIPSEKPLNTIAVELLKKNSYDYIKKCPKGCDYIIKSDMKTRITIICQYHGMKNYLICKKDKENTLTEIPVDE